MEQPKKKKKKEKRKKQKKQSLSAAASSTNMEDAGQRVFIGSAACLEGRVGPHWLALSWGLSTNYITLCLPFLFSAQTGRRNPLVQMINQVFLFLLLKHPSMSTGLI